MVFGHVARIKHGITYMNIAHYCYVKSSAIRGTMQRKQELYIDASHRHLVYTPFSPALAHVPPHGYVSRFVLESTQATIYDECAWKDNTARQSKPVDT